MDSLEILGSTQGSGRASELCDSSDNMEESQSSLKCEPEVADDLDITLEEANENYNKIGELVNEGQPVETIEELQRKYPVAFTEESKEALASVLEEIKLKFKLSPFQEAAVNGLLNGMDLMVIVPTGSGKMLIIFLYSLALRKLPNGYRGLVRDSNKSIVIASVPLTSIILQQLGNAYCKVALLTVEGELKGLKNGEVQSLVADEVLSGDFFILFVHPESLSSEKGHILLKRMKVERLLWGIVSDEVHQGLEGHWDSF